jgi:hypothetical protein
MHAPDARALTGDPPAALRGRGRAASARALPGRSPASAGSVLIEALLVGAAICAGATLGHGARRACLERPPSG